MFLENTAIVKKPVIYCFDCQQFGHMPNTALESLSAATVDTKNIILVAIPLFLLIAIRKAIHLHLEIVQLFFQKIIQMKLLQFNITSLNTSLEEL